MLYLVFGDSLIVVKNGHVCRRLMFGHRNALAFRWFCLRSTRG